MKTFHTPNCLGSEVNIYKVSDLNRGLRAPEFNFLGCNTCGLVRMTEIPENIAEYYPKTYYKLPSLASIEKKSSKEVFKIKLVQKFLTQGRLLEIGPAFGVFALQAKNAGFKVQTIEQDEDCCKILSDLLAIPAVRSDRPDQAILALGTQEAIALWHVIEHLPNPWTVIESAAKMLSANGYLFIAAPNPQSFQYRLMKKYWPHLDAPRHAYLLPINALQKYAESVGLELVHQSTSDSYAREMNRFGWQRIMMNNVPTFPLKVVAYLLGYPIAWLLSYKENRERMGSAYTLVFRKL